MSCLCGRGEWCSWCTTMENDYEADRLVSALSDKMRADKVISFLLSTDGVAPRQWINRLIKQRVKELLNANK